MRWRPSLVDLSDPQDVAKVAKGARQTRARARDVLRSVMSGPMGREFIYNHLAECGLYRNPFSTDSQVTAFNCGMMNAGQALLAQIMDICPELYSKMIEEENERRAAYARNAARGNSGSNAGDDGAFADEPDAGSAEG